MYILLNNLFCIVSNFILEISDYINQYLEKIIDFIFNFFDKKEVLISEKNYVDGIVESKIDTIEPIKPIENSEETDSYLENYFSSKTEMESFLLKLSIFSVINKMSPELVFYAFCEDRNIQDSNLQYKINNLANISFIDFFNSLKEFEILYSNIFENDKINFHNTKIFAKYLKGIMFHNKSNIKKAYYSSYYLKFLAKAKEC